MNKTDKFHILRRKEIIKAVEAENSIMEVLEMTMKEKKPIDFKKVGGKIHKILNLTFLRKLSLKEYQKLIDLISSVFEEAQKPRIIDRMRMVVYLDDDARDTLEEIIEKANL